MLGHVEAMELHRSPGPVDQQLGARVGDGVLPGLVGVVEEAQNFRELFEGFLKAHK